MTQGQQDLIDTLYKGRYYVSNTFTTQVSLTELYDMGFQLTRWTCLKLVMRVFLRVRLNL